MRALTKFPADDSVQNVFAQAISDEAGLVVISALEGLMKIAPGTAQSLLVEALRHRDEEVVKTALALLRQCAASDWLEAEGARLLKHVSRDVRVLVADMLGQYPDPLALTLLENRMELETDPLVIRALETALSAHKRRLTGVDS
jgi:HEAT repeat protein